MTTPTLARTPHGAVSVPFALVRGADVAVINVVHRLRTELGEDPENPARGLPWSRWLSTPNVPLAEISGAVRGQAAAVAGVQAVTLASAARTSTGIEVVVEFLITVGDQTLSARLTIRDPYQTSGPPILLMLLP